MSGVVYKVDRLTKELTATYESGCVANFGDICEPFKVVLAKRPSDGEIMVCELTVEHLDKIRAALA